MEKILSELSTEKVKAAAEMAVESIKSQASGLGERAKEKIVIAAESAKDAKLVSDLMSDIEEKPEKVKREAGIAGAAALAVFTGRRLWDAYGGKAPKPDSTTDDCE